MNLIINEFQNAFKAFDRKGRKMHYSSRYASCFIITLKGSIRFSYCGGSVTSDKNHPVFLPKGLSYTNECLETAESIVFNFSSTGHFSKPEYLRPVSPEFANSKFDTVKNAENSQDNLNHLLVLSEIYNLAYHLLAKETPVSRTDEILNSAIEYMTENHSDPSLTAYHIASHCFVSEIYLRKIFSNKMGTTPHRALTEIRMKKAYLYALDKRPVKEIALNVGYRDVYQFSRAYKRFFGYSPSKTV